jgi:hypothetical protein
MEAAIEKLLIFLMLKSYRDKKIAECDMLVRGCESRTSIAYFAERLGRGKLRHEGVHLRAVLKFQIYCEFRHIEPPMTMGSYPDVR